MFYKPEQYMLPQMSQPSLRNSQEFSGQNSKADYSPTRGAANNPYIPPTKYKDILKQKTIEEPKPKFIRDNLNVDDIGGTKAKPLYKGVAKTIIGNTDIKGSSPNLEKYKPRTYDLLNYSDVNEKKIKHESLRDPLNPVYNYQIPEGGIRKYGEIQGSRPKATLFNQKIGQILNQHLEPSWITNQKFPVLRPDPIKSLDTTISELNTKSFYAPQMTVFPENYDYYGKPKEPKDVLRTNDIQGTHSGSKPKITLKEAARQVNPLEPEYKYPGYKEVQNQLQSYNRLRQSLNGRQEQTYNSNPTQHNDNVFMRSSIHSIHNDRYNTLNRSNSNEGSESPSRLSMINDGSKKQQPNI